jgi:hypothetical protein
MPFFSRNKVLYVACIKRQHVTCTCANARFYPLLTTVTLRSDCAVGRSQRRPLSQCVNWAWCEIYMIGRHLYISDFLEPTMGTWSADFWVGIASASYSPLLRSAITEAGELYGRSRTVAKLGLGLLCSTRSSRSLRPLLLYRIQQVGSRVIASGAGRGSAYLTVFLWHSSAPSVDSLIRPQIRILPLPSIICIIHKSACNPAFYNAKCLERC